MWEELKNYIESTQYDVYFTDDRCDGNVNSGFYIIKLNDNIQKVIDFFDRVLSEMKRGEHQNDQTIINQHKHTINYGYIPEEYIILGPVIIDTDKALLHHAVCEGSISGKIAQMESIQARIESRV